MEIPIFLQISQFIEDEIMSGALSSHDKVPSMNEFARNMEVNPATAGKGLNALVVKGVLYKKRGVGMFVTPEAKDIITQERRQHFIEQSVPAFVKEGRALSLNDEELSQLIKEAYHATDS
ncbi:GntR family transcriptional regulator [Aerococcus kribbianus]|uniref:GntR family transcriptional regulator n=1 Tax=Aerococcus kribbianus TaxID=2999064 RepID=A0A9X3FUZ3_9LACT|nr:MULTISPECIES: GntR family transcriptional regulator [unclassified Aerococcus]MCZ0717431.1 GntR family transcriptional regulator [Aerococcus sp. YH-aer221]MCZ0725719.1 GntR family transcriptional regulator [Aerococcus sp. YH-aer222]